MKNPEKVLQDVLKRSTDQNMDFIDLCNLLKALGFNRRVKGSHHIFYADGIKEILNLQPKKSKAKAYQVKQVRALILKYKLGGNLDV